MHILLDILGTVVTILVLLKRLADAGIDLGGLNPFLWNRRRKWRGEYTENPIYRLESPMDATALLMAAVAKASGDITRDHKQMILSLFGSEFHLSKRDAASLLVASTHMLSAGEEASRNVAKVLAPSVGQFTASHRVANVDEALSETQTALLADLANALRSDSNDESRW
jgi:hypothetical protein